MVSDTRRKDLAKIHLAKKQLGLDDEQYRDLLWVVARVRSSADLDEFGRKKIINHLRDCGATFKAPKRSGKRPHNYNRLPEYITKVEALLTDMGLSWAYADSIARNITGGKGNPTSQPGVDKLAWVKKDTHWRALIAALYAEQEKRAKHAAILEMLQELGKDESHIVELLQKARLEPRNWHRNRLLMNRIIEHLEAQHD